MEKVEDHPRDVARASRRFPVGAELSAEGGVHFRVWAPKRKTVQVALTSDPRDRHPSTVFDLKREEIEPSGPGNWKSRRSGPSTGGYFSGLIGETAAGMFYGFRLDGSSQIVPDPASRFQPEGPEGLSQVVDPESFPWTDAGWKGLEIPGQVIYETHVGTLTPEGTWQSAAERLPDIREAGMTVVEVMPVADFHGQFGWGYDGVCLYSPSRLYGTPDDFRGFVDRAHALGLGVILDVVYNHFGMVDCSIAEFSDDYFSRRHKNEWGSPINFDDENCGPVREFFSANVRYWIEEFHLDGFRFDATQQICDDSETHILTEMVQAARKSAGHRSVILLAENEPQDVRIVKPPEKGGHGLDAMCNDDFHHTSRVRLTGLTEAYYEDYRGTIDELRSSILRGFLYQGQISQHQGKRRGSPARGLPATNLIHFLQNHDQIANTGLGRRIHELASPAKLRAMTALWLLSPQTPMFFQGQEFAASSPFLYFADFSGKVREAVAQGRLKFLSQFPAFATEEFRRAHPDPAARSTFEQSKIRWADREEHSAAYALHQDLLALRRDDPLFRRQRADLIDASSLNADCVVLRYFSDDDTGSDRLLIVNFGMQLFYSPSPEPLLAPPERCRWELLWTSETVRYGGRTTPAVETAEGWNIPAETAVVLRAVVRPSGTNTTRMSGEERA